MMQKIFLVQYSNYVAKQMRLTTTVLANNRADAYARFRATFANASTNDIVVHYILEII